MDKEIEQNELINVLKSFDEGALINFDSNFQKKLLQKLTKKFAVKNIRISMIETLPLDENEIHKVIGKAKEIHHIGVHHNNEIVCCLDERSATNFLNICYGVKEDSFFDKKKTSSLEDFFILDFIKEFSQSLDCDDFSIFNDTNFYIAKLENSYFEVFFHFIKFKQEMLA